MGWIWLLALGLTVLAIPLLMAYVITPFMFWRRWRVTVGGGLRVPVPEPWDP